MHKISAVIVGVTYSGCNVRKRAEEIEQVKVVANISYAEAVKKIQEQRRSHETDKDKDISRQEVCQAVESNPTLPVDGLISFIW